MMGFIRARTEEQIFSRQEEIINACDVLYSQYGYEGVNFKAISEMTSFKRPTIYIYYKTKDEVLLDLLKKEMLDWDVSMQRVIQTTEIMTKEQYGAFLTESAASRKKMLRLLTILCTTIENQCRLEKLIGFKKEADGAFVTIRESLDKYFPQGDISKKNFFMTSFLSYIHGLYPLAYPSKKQSDAMVLAGRTYIAPDFNDTLYHGILLLLADL
ncbi:TetR/AcrR family transcriptional regulator [Treponema sp. TIM-1]|uniref:TetR family transcriptional regulator n=1 Tax=Treponema sp. TIM-1 TaxID=2898417 RepID=UPI0039811B00